MPNTLDANGLTTQTQTEVLDNYTTAYETIYGSDIDLESDTPDGQMVNIETQVVVDLLDFLVQIYNSFNPDTAVGVSLDQRCAINGVIRQGGTYTVTPITVVTSQSVNLYGSDQTVQPVYTVSDASGNTWLLQTTQLAVSIGSNVFDFQSATPGNVLAIPNTITIPVTIVLGVTSINNPTAATTQGVAEESDAALRIRRAQSVSMSSQGYLAGLIAALLNIPGVSYAEVYENDTNTTNADGTAGHTIWVIVAGSGAASAIANAIYTKRNAGAGMRGGVSYTITQVDGSPFMVNWDDVIPVPLFIYLNVTSINSAIPPNIAAIRSGLVTALTPGVNTDVNINQVSTLVQQIDPNTVVTSAQLSTGTVQTITFASSPSTGAFVINYNGNNTSSIPYGASAATIQTAVQAVAGAAGITVTGSPTTTQTIVLNLTTLTSVGALAYLSSNSTGVAVSYSAAGSAIVSPSTKQNQFVVSSANTIILPMQMTSTAVSVAPLGTATFTALGGYGAYSYAVTTNVSGGSINAATGAYTAGSSGGTDVITVTDSFGNQKTLSILVT